MKESLRTIAQRKAETIKKLETQRDVFVATASPSGEPHLVPFSLDWNGQQVIAATLTRSITVANVKALGRARLSVGDTRDVVLVDVDVTLQDAARVDKTIGDHFAARNGWDPRVQNEPWVFLIMSPRRIQAWCNEPELEGRTILKDGRWLV